MSLIREGVGGDDKLKKQAEALANFVAEIKALGKELAEQQGETPQHAQLPIRTSRREPWLHTAGEKDMAHLRKIVW